jgi:hypothetical protein
MRRATNILELLTVAAVCGLGACSTERATVAGDPVTDTVPKYSMAGGLNVYNTQLRSRVPTATAFGHAQVKCPNDPYRAGLPQDPHRMTISGIIFNPDANALGEGAGIYFYSGFSGDEVGTLVAPLDITLPPNPVRNFRFDGTTEITAELAGQISNDPAQYSIRIGNLEGFFR